MTSTRVDVSSRLRRILLIAVSLAFAALFAAGAAVFVLGPSAQASTCTLTTTLPVTPWSDPTKWTGCAGTYPGANSGDTAIVGLSSFNLNVDAIIPNGVILQMTGTGINVTIPSGNGLRIEASSSSNSSNVVNINGGTLKIGTGNVTWGGNLALNTGTLDLVGTLQHSLFSTYSINGGTVNGGGTLQVNSGNGLSITGSGGGINIDNATIDNFGIISYTVPNSQSLSLLNAAKIKVESSAQFNITNDGPIQTNNVGSPMIQIFTSGALSKSSGTTTQIDAEVDNNGSVTVSTGRLNLYGGGIHGGTFSTATGGTTMAFSGTHTLNGGTSAIGGGTMEVIGGNFDVFTTAASPFAPSTFKQSAGTIGGTGTFRVNSTFTWTGGTQTSSGTTELPGTTNVNGGAVALDFGRIISNSGTFNFAPTSGGLSIDNGAHIDNTGTVSLQNDASITSSSPSTSYISNSSTALFEKTAGTTSNVGCGITLNGQATLRPAAGTTIALSGGTPGAGNIGGAIATIDLTGTSSKVDFTGGNFTVAGTALTVTGGGTLRLSGTAGFLLTSGPLSVTDFVQDGTSFLQSSGPGITIPAGGTYAWNGGTIDGLSAASDVITVNGATAALKLTGSSGAMTMQSGAHIKNAGGTITFNPVSSLSVNSGSVIDNAAGTFAFNNNNAIGITTDNNSNPRFLNNGNVTKAANPNTTQIDVKFDHNTTLTVNGGTLRLAGGGTTAGSMVATNAADRIEISGGPYFTTTGATFGGAGTLAINPGAVFTNNTALNVTNFELDGGTINGGGSLTINNGFKWLRGTFSGGGSAGTANGIVTDATALTGNMTLADGFTFNNNGPFNYNPSFSLDFSNTGVGGATFNNNATGIFDIQGNGATTFSGSGHAFANAGTVKKTAGAGGFTFTIPVANSGSIDNQFGSSSTIAFNATGGTMTAGSIQSSNSAGKIDFTGGTFAVSGGGFSGAGRVRVIGGQMNVNANVNATTTFEVSGSGVLDVSSPNTFQITSLEWGGGTIQGSGTKRVFGGFISSAAPTTLGGTGTLTIPATSFSYSADAVNYLTIINSAKLNVENGATIDITGNGIIAGIAPAKLSSTGGTLKLSAAAVPRIDVPIDFTVGSGGTINVQAGTLELNGGGIIGGSAGSIQIAPATQLSATGGTLSINASATLSGTGTFRINGAAVNVNTPLTFANLQLDSGSLGGTAAVTLDGGKWKGGDMTGTGTTTLNAGKTFELSTGTLKKLQRNFTNNGLVFTQTLPAALTLENAAVFANNSLVELQANTNFFCTCTPTPSIFHNTATGTLRTTIASGTSNFLTTVNNDGTVDVQTGILNFLAGGTHTGAFTAGANTFLSFGGASDSFSSAVTVGGTGAVGYGATSSVFAGTHTLTGNGQTIVQGGVTFNSASAISTPALEMLSGSIGGTANIAVNGGGTSSSAWQGGTIGGTGSFTIASGATMDFNASTAPITLDGRTITNNGAIIYTATGNTLALTNGASIATAGIFDIQSDAAVNVGPGTNSFTNTGTFQKTAGTLTTNFLPAFTNGNFVTLTTGTISFDGGFTQSAGVTTLNGGNMASPFNIAINGGTLRGTGTVTGNILNTGTIAPGLSPGGITISGNYTQAPGSIIDIELAGTTPVTNYDQLTITGAANFNNTGTLNVSLISGFVPSNNDTFDIIKYASNSGVIATQNLPPSFPGGGSFTYSYQPTELRLTAITTQADLIAAQTTSGPALHGQNASFTVTVTNNGPNTATGVTLTDTMSGAALAGATSTVGTCNTASPIVCTIGTLNSGQSAVVTITVNANTVSTISNSAATSGTEFDPNTANNNTGTANITVSPAADLAVTVTDAADPVAGNTTTTYTVTVSNLGPDSAASAAVALTMTNGTMISATSANFACAGSVTNQTCNAIGALAPGNSTITVTVQTPAASGTMSLKAVASSATGDPIPANNVQIQSTNVTTAQADLAITKTGPPTIASGGTITYTIVVTNNGASDATNVVVNDPAPAHATFLGTSAICNNAFPCNLGTLTSGQSKTITATYKASNNRANEGRTITNIASVTSDVIDPVSNNNQARVDTTIACENETPDRLAPAGGITMPANGTLTWRGNGVDYTVFLGPAGTGCTMQFGTSSTESLAYSNLTEGAAYEWRVVSSRGVCATLSSSCEKFVVEKKTPECTRPETPVLRVVGQQTSSKTYSVEWDAIPGAVRYELDEATNAAFANATTFAVQGLSRDFKHDVTTANAFYYRVRAFNNCGESGAYSLTGRVVIVPLPPKDKPGRNVNIPAGSQEVVVQQVFVPGEPNQSLFFSATTDRPWLTVKPSNGPLPPQGITLDVTADPATLPNGTFTASVIVTITGNSANGVATHGVTAVTVPVSVNLVTPVSPVASKDAASQYAMVIPSVGHLDGINSFWQSDVRITNAGFRAYRYKLTFTPSGGTAQGVQQTTINVDAGATTALDDIVRNWYGLGALGDNASGMLEILPLDEPQIASAATVASSRTYNVTDNGTLGQFIPAVRFTNFIGAFQNAQPASILSLQQIAESASYRTNFGIAEGSGNPASVLFSIFNSAGTKLLTVPMSLAAGEQRQLNSFLAENKISLTDGRVEVQVAGGGGKVTAYASVIDNATRDPLLVNGTILGASNSKWVLPGVANIDNPVAHWRTDMRVFNSGASVQPATLTFYPGGNGAPKSTALTLAPGAVLSLDDVLSSKFGLVNAGGVVHLTTGSASSIVVTGRTYNQTTNGTFGQFIPAVTPDEAVGAGGPTLHILQVEDSTRYRTNIGLAEVTGAPATVELQVVLPDSKFTPTVTVPLAANEFRQFSLLRDLALGNVYNARVTARVISGNGRVTAYGSVIDEQTQDPTYVPAQK
ncbi:MAG TPA: hypothetical protein VJZ00_07385 [Thermoanaerobaculia bacterium]|nr:hypothetical protein [Thermoanaerobaculia bacterium]